MPAEAELAVLARSWWVFGVIGLVSVVAGVIILAEPSISLATLSVLTGIYFLVDGIFELIYSLFNAQENRGLTAVFGAISAIAGVILIRHPTHAVAAIALLAGLWLLVAGLVRLVRAFSQPAHRLWAALWGALELIAGIVIVSSPGIGVATLALFVGISLIVRGVAAGAVAFSVRKLGHQAEAASP